MEFMNIKYVAKMLENSRHCVIGVSGGVDSMVLLDWFAKNQHHFRCSFKVIHIDHGINENSNEWAMHVLNACRALNISCDVRKVSLDGYGSNLEYAARQARYREFCSNDADTLVLAHHANDQCESFLLKLFRGSGVRGLKAMSQTAPCWFDSRVTVIRPMLEISKAEIENYAAANNIVSIEDPSNQDTKYDRNYIRNVIWPTITDRFEIADINTIRSIQHLAETWQLTNQLADIDIANCTQMDGTLNWPKVKEIGYLRIKNMLLRIIDNHDVYGISVNHVEQFAQGLLSADMDSRNELRLKGFNMQKIGKTIYINAVQQRAA